MNRLLSTSLSGVTVYVLVAACSGVGAPGEGGLGGGGLGAVGKPVPPAEAASGGQSTTGGSGNGAATSCECPEPQAPPEPVVITRTCPGSSDSSSPRPFDFPGFEEEELAQFTAISRGTGGPEGFMLAVKPYVLGDQAAVYCSGGQEVRFIVPGHLASKLEDE